MNIFLLNWVKDEKNLQSLIVRDRCKLELWDHADDLDLGAPADLVSHSIFIKFENLLKHKRTKPLSYKLYAMKVIDRMPWWKVGNKYVDSLDDDHEEMNEAISAFR